MSESVSSCPTQDDLAGYLGNSLNGDFAGKVKEHLKACGKCRNSLTSLLKVKGEKQAAQLSPAFSPALPTAPVATPPAAPIPRTGTNNPIPSFQVKPKKPLAPAYEFLDPPTQEGSLGVLGNYELIKVLGEGGMGIVFEAIDRELNRRVALKVLRPELADEIYRKRFAREAKIAGGLHDENICTIYHVGQYKDVPFLAMEYLQGENLEDYLKREGFMPVPLVFRLTKEMARGLDAAHKQNLIHRDIKPANIWLEKGNFPGEIKRVKILDFGLARAIGQENQLTAQGMIVGTPNYMAPEQIEGSPLDSRADLFSLGCVVYRMLSGKIPFDKENTLAVLQAVLEVEIPSLENMERQMPQSALTLLTKLLARDPNQRPSNAQEVIEIIIAFEQGTGSENFNVLKSILFKAPIIPPGKSVKKSSGILFGIIALIAALVFGIFIGLAKLLN
ncbi:MAG: serine/threonine protein kinase [Gemmataceae bacterium]|nr:serine/threonine protein kinase [Gemmataceae bacterium]